jgi:hypothetical protein
MADTITPREAGARRRWAAVDPETRRQATEEATKARGRVADALARVDQLEAQVAELRDLVLQREQIAA